MGMVKVANARNVEKETQKAEMTIWLSRPKGKQELTTTQLPGLGVGCF